MAIKLDIGEEDINIALKDVIYDKYIEHKVEARLRETHKKTLAYHKNYVQTHLDLLESNREIKKRLEALENKCKIKKD